MRVENTHMNIQLSADTCNESLILLEDKCISINHKILSQLELRDILLIWSVFDFELF